MKTVQVFLILGALIIWGAWTIHLFNSLIKARQERAKYMNLVSEMRSWLKQGATIKATNPNGRILELLPDGSFDGGLTITGAGGHFDVHCRNQTVTGATTNGQP